MNVAKRRQDAFQKLHFTQCEQEREGRFGPLVLVDAVFLQAIAAAAGLGVVKFQAQVITAQEPLKGQTGLLQPDGVFGGLKRVNAGRDRGEGFQRLLVELGAFASAMVEALRADGAEVPGGRLLLADQPGQGLEPDIERLGMPAGLAAGDQALAKPGVIVSEILLEPAPFLGRRSARTTRSADRSGCRESGWPGALH